MKKSISILLALVLLLSFGVTAFANGEAPAKNDSITVNDAKAGETYRLYKLFDLIVDSESDPTAYSYKVNEDWAAFFAAAEGETPAGPGKEYVIINEAGYVTEISDAAALAKAAAEWTGKPANPTQSVTVATGETTAVFSNLPDGYWLITSTLGTLAMTETTPDKSAVEVNEKNPEDTITKEVKEDSSGAYGESNDVQIGDTVEFRSTVKIVKGTRNVVVHDIMIPGLTYTAGSAAITGLTKGTEYTVNESPADDHTFDISFDQTWIDGLDFGTEGYKEYVITYTATVTKDAVGTGDDGNPAVNPLTNTTSVSFGDGSSSESDSTTTTTHNFSVYKHASGKTENLDGAVFSLKKNGTVVKLIKIDDTNYRVAEASETGAVENFTTVKNGDIVIWGVDSDDDYTLEEITPPDGYNKLTAEVPVTVNADIATRVDVENQSGQELPSTGGIGTTLFYVIGGLMVAGAAVVLISKKRME